MPWDLEVFRVAIIYKVKRGLALRPSESIVDLDMFSIERKAALQEQTRWQTRWRNSVKGRATVRVQYDRHWTDGTQIAG